jgi:hypothetical protein
MRFLARRIRSIPVFPIALLLFTVATLGCENKHIGRPCELGVPDEPGASASTITGEVLACPTRICMIPAAERPTDTKSYCSTECSTNDDCGDGELRDKGVAGDKRCQGGFVCGVAAVIGEFCCKKLCICKDFLPSGTNQVPTPPTCSAGAASTCRNVH